VARALYATYAIGTSLAFAALVCAVHAAPSRREDRPLPSTVLFGPLLVWNPVQAMGFLPFMVGLPIALAAAALVVRVAASRRSRAPLPWIALAAALVAAAFAHVVTLALVALFVALFAAGLVIARAPAPASRRAFAAAAASLTALALALGVGRPAAARVPWADVLDAVRRYGFARGIAGALRLAWDTPGGRAHVFYAGLVGPLPDTAKTLVAASWLAVAAFAARAAWQERRETRAIRRTPLAPPPAPAAVPRAFAFATAAFFAINALVPSSIQVPDDMCLCELRMFVVTAALLAAAIPPRWLETFAARRAIAAHAAMALGAAAWALVGAASEASPVVRLVARLGSRDVLLALPFRDRSAYYDRTNALLHYLPVWHTAMAGGPTSLFWGGSILHLPVAYRAGAEPPHPPDWQPWRFTNDDVRAATHVLVGAPDPDDDPDAETSDAFAHVAALARAGDLEEVACEDAWCLFRVTSSGLEYSAK
jgi:hypothetical protein